MMPQILAEEGDFAVIYHDECPIGLWRSVNTFSIRLAFAAIEIHGLSNVRRENDKTEENGRRMMVGVRKSHLLPVVDQPAIFGVGVCAQGQYAIIAASEVPKGVRRTEYSGAIDGSCETRIEFAHRKAGTAHGIGYSAGPANDAFGCLCAVLLTDLVKGIDAVAAAETKPLLRCKRDQVPPGCVFRYVGKLSLKTPYFESPRHSLMPTLIDGEHPIKSDPSGSGLKSDVDIVWAPPMIDLVDDIKARMELKQQDERVERYTNRQRAADGQYPVDGKSFTERSDLKEWDKAYQAVHSEAWSARLRELQAETKERERNRVTCQSQYLDDDD